MNGVLLGGVSETKSPARMGHLYPVFVGWRGIDDPRLIGFWLFPLSARKRRSVQLRCHKTPISGKRLAAFRDEYNALISWLVSITKVYSIML